MGLALALLVACSAGVPTGTDTGLTTDDAPLVVNPRSLLLEANQVSVFKAYASGVPGDSLVTSIEWTATGGSIGLDGTYSSPSTGDYNVVGKRHGPNRTTSDTANVIVVPPQPTVTIVVVSPQSAYVAAKTQQTFSAAGKLSDGSTVAIGVTWTATGGNTGAGWVYTAGSTAGSYKVIAKAASTNAADTVPVTALATLSPHQSLATDAATVIDAITRFIAAVIDAMARLVAAGRWSIVVTFVVWCFRRAIRTLLLEKPVWIVRILEALAELVRAARGNPKGPDRLQGTGHAPGPRIRRGALSGGRSRERASSRAGSRPGQSPQRSRSERPGAAQMAA
jgi:hypothetical protein